MFSTHTEETLYVLLLNKNNELSGHKAVNCKYSFYSFLGAINTEEEDVTEVIEI